MKSAVLLLFSGAALYAGNAPTVTFYRDVLPILQTHCQSCHRPGEIGPMAFGAYPETRPWAKAIKQAVLLKQMPPWYADAPPGRFHNDPRLSQPEIDKLVAWADTGASAVVFCNLGAQSQLATRSADHARGCRRRGPRASF